MDYHTSGLTSRSSAVEQEEPATWIMDSCVYYTPWTVKCFAYVCIVTNNALNRGLMGILESYVTFNRKNLSPTFYMFRFESRCQFGKPGFPRGQSIFQPILGRWASMHFCAAILTSPRFRFYGKFPHVHRPCATDFLLHI